MNALKNNPIIAAVLVIVIIAAVFFVFKSLAPAPVPPLDEPPIARADTPGRRAKRRRVRGSEAPGMHLSPSPGGPPSAGP